MKKEIEHALSEIAEIEDIDVYGRVSKVQGLLVECIGLHHAVSVGSRCHVVTRNGKKVLVEVVGLDQQKAMLMPYSSVEGIGVGCKVVIDHEESVVYPDMSWQGRIINSLGEPVDDKGPLIKGGKAYPYRNSPPHASKRKPVAGKIDLGVRAINTFLSCCKGQRMGIFAGSGVGKSMLVSMLTKFSKADIKVIGLIGERGRELYEFIHEYLGEEGLKSAVIIAATSDESALMRRQAAYLTMTVSEYFRDQGKNVLCLMDSVTRFAMAQREIGLSAGEPPATKGYTPTVFVEMPQLLERAGPGLPGQGDITGLFSVLVEGDDHNEPISDAVRGILDGHIVLDRAIADRGRYPAINILRSVSRTLPNCNTTEQNQIVSKARSYLSTYEDMAEMIRLGAYRQGSSAEVDEAMLYYPKIEAFLAQEANEHTNLEQCYAIMQNILNGGDAQMPQQDNNVEAANTASANNHKALGQQ